MNKTLLTILTIGIICFFYIQPILPQNGLDITNKTNLVSIYYVLWFNTIVGSYSNPNPIYNITNILKANPTNPQWGPAYSNHYWAEPAPGYYRSDDTTVIRKHIQQLTDAGIDFIILEDTNGMSTRPANYYSDVFQEPATVFVQTLYQMRKEGKKTPYICFWAGTWDGIYSPNLKDPNPAYCGLDIYNRFYSNPQYKDLFVYYESKPLLLVTDSFPDTLKSLFTMRKCWNYPDPIADSQWTYGMYPQQVTMHNGIKEELSITPAIERTYMNANPCVTRRGGKTFQEEWQYAFAQRPKVVMMSEWNEWTAIRIVQDSNSYFTDQYDRTRSRDIEPMKGGHGDLYYRWMEQYIAAYKNGQTCPDSLLEVNEAVRQIDALPSVSSATEADTSMVEAVRDFVNSIVIKEYDYEIKTSDISNYTKLTDLEAKLGILTSVGQILNQQNDLFPAKFTLSQFKNPPRGKFLTNIPPKF